MTKHGSRRVWSGRVWSGLGVALVILIFLAYHWYENRMESALLRTSPNLVAQDLGLVNFAIARAKPAYAKNCASCHGADLQGNPSLGAPNLTDKDFLYDSGQVAEIEKTIYFGIRSANRKARNLADMPAFGRAPSATDKYKVTPLAPQEIRDVIAYLFVAEGRPADKLAAARGQAIYAGKGSCFDCHSPYGHGDSGIGAPNLTDNVWLYGDGSEESIFRSIAVGHHGVCPPWVNVLPAATIRALAVYFNSKSQTTATAIQQNSP